MNDMAALGTGIRCGVTLARYPSNIQLIPFTSFGFRAGGVGWRCARMIVIGNMNKQLKIFLILPSMSPPPSSVYEPFSFALICRLSSKHGTLKWQLKQ